MNKTLDFLAGIKILEEVESPINGKLTVVRDLLYGVYIKGGGLPQSGGLAEKIWKITLKKIQKDLKVKKCLIVGMGGGGIAKLVRQYWPDSEIIGVDVDLVMVDLGRKYLNLDKTGAKVVIADAYEYMANVTKNSEKWDLVCVDVYVERSVPKKFETEDFIKLIKKALTIDGTAIFNRLYGKEDKEAAENLHRKLIHIFKKVRPVYPEANVMYVCSV